MNQTRVSSWLGGLGSARIYFDPLFGNHGDQLITLAAERLLRQAGVTRVTQPGDAEFIIVNGGGGMAGRWPGMGIVLRYSERFPHIPLAVLPSSFLFEQAPDADLFSHRTAPIWLWARERYSEQSLRQAGFSGDVRIHLDHDLAFSLAGSQWLEEVARKAPRQPPHLLIVERDDWEGPTGRSRPLSIPGLGFIPEEWRNAVRRILVAPLRKRQDRVSAFRVAAEGLLAGNGLASPPLPLLCADISLAETGSFDEFTEGVANARALITTRLHVAILGHLMERPTWLVEGAYYKCRGVYEYSMQGGATQLLRWQDGALRAPDGPAQVKAGTGEAEP